MKQRGGALGEGDLSEILGLFLTVFGLRASVYGGGYIYGTRANNNKCGSPYVWC